MSKNALVLAFWLALVAAASAQSVGGMSGIINALGGSSGGVPGVGCTNQLVLDYSNSCALIGQAFGE